MPEYIVQRHLPGNDYGEWGRDEEFYAGNDEEAKRIVMGLLSGSERLQQGDIRIMKVVFRGQPSDTGYPYLPNPRVERLEATQIVTAVDLELLTRSATLDYKELNFILSTVPESPAGPGYDLRLLYSAGYGFKGYAGKEEVEHAKNEAKLAPEDITISAYYIAGPKGAQCVSVSKVVSFEQDSKTPKELIHLWPRAYPNLAIDPEKLREAEIRDERR